MNKVEQFAVLLLDSAWTLADLTKVIDALTLEGSKARSLPQVLVTRFAIPPSRNNLVTFLRQTKLGREIRLRLIQKLLVTVRCEPHPMRSAVSVLSESELPPFSSVSDFADFAGLPVKMIDWLAEQRNEHYQVKLIRKRSSGMRFLEAPKVRLKSLQRLIAREILNVVPCHIASHGFTPGRSAITYIEPHIGRSVVLRMDLQDFFPSINSARVFGLFRSFGYPHFITQLLCKLCTTSVDSNMILRAIAHQDHMAMDRIARDRLLSIFGQCHLPQGAPTSPQIANLIAFRLDCRLDGLAKAAGLRYTRYVDDLLFSGEPDFGRTLKSFAHQVAVITLDEGFEINYRKTREMRRSTRQFAAGIVFNQRPNLQRAAYDELKATLYNCIKKGTADQNRNHHHNFRAFLLGRINWVTQLNPDRGEKLMKLFAAISWPPIDGTAVRIPKDAGVF